MHLPSKCMYRMIKFFAGKITFVVEILYIFIEFGVEWYFEPVSPMNVSYYCMIYDSNTFPELVIYNNLFIPGLH